MTRNVAVTRYANLSIILHWLMLALFVGVYASVELKGMLPRGSSARSLLMGFHGLFGLSIFALVWLRLLGRLTPRPPLIPKPPAWQTGARDFEFSRSTMEVNWALGRSAVEAAMKEGQLLAESIAEGRSDSFTVQSDMLRPKDS